jgi:hypothetical protein
MAYKALALSRDLLSISFFTYIGIPNYAQACLGSNDSRPGNSQQSIYYSYWLSAQAAKQEVVTANRRRESRSETEKPQQAPSWAAVY